MKSSSLALFLILSLASCGKEGTPRPSGSGSGASVSGPLPAGWNGGDVGSVGLPGTSAHAGGTFSVGGSGADIWGNADGFRFLWQALNGDGTIVARVLSLDPTDAWAKAGVMIRESLDAGSPFAMSVVTPANGTSMQYRSTGGGAANLTMGPVQGAPHWVKIARQGSTFSGSTSADGVTWSPIADVTIPMGANVLIGLCVTAHNNSARATAQFDSVQVSGAGGGGLGAWQNLDIGPVGQAGSASLSGGTFTIGASGADIWGAQDAFHFVHQTLNGDGQITARIQSLDATDVWAKSGVMIRESLADNAAFAMSVVTPGNGTSFQYRDAAGGGANLIPGPGGAAPRWLRLSRTGSTFSASASSDGSSWTSIGSLSISMGSSVRVGLCVTAHNNSALAFSAIDSVTLGSPSVPPPPPPPPPPSGTISVSTPSPRIVYQRNNANQAFIPLRGSCSAGVTSVQARVQALNGGQSTDWTTIDGAPSGGSFRGSLTVSGGWYQLEVRALQNGTSVATTGVDRVGAGEVFIVVGHSVAQGQDINIEGSTDERGVTIPDNRSNATMQQYNDTADPQYMPAKVFTQYSNGVKPAPFGAGTYFWAKFAQVVAQNQNVPVLMLNAAFGGTSLEHWSKAAQGLPFDHSFVKSSIRMPYINLYNALKQYIPLTGCRAILADQGANDWPNQNSDQVFGYYQTWVNQARADLGYGALAIVVNRHTPFGNGGIRQAQQRMINEVPNCFTGPDYDTLAPGDRYDGIHMSESGCWAAAQKWADALNGGSFFSSSQPYLPGFP